MNVGPCHSCNLVRVPENTICFDCAYPSPERRQSRVEQLEFIEQQSRTSLRDKFALAALPFALERGPSLIGGSATGNERIQLAAAYAYTIADAMMHEREQKP